MIRIIALCLLAIAVSATAVSKSFANERYGKQKVVYHINYKGGENDAAYHAALNNIKNQINAVGEGNIEVKVVLHGAGVDLLQDAIKNQKLQMDVLNLRARKVKFDICNNTLVARKIDYKKDLFEVYQEDIVPSGVAELSRLQQMGYTYIKP